MKIEGTCAHFIQLFIPLMVGVVFGVPGKFSDRRSIHKSAGVGFEKSHIIGATNLIILPNILSVNFIFL